MRGLGLFTGREEGFGFQLRSDWGILLTCFTGQATVTVKIRAYNATGEVNIMTNNHIRDVAFTLGTIRPLLLSHGTLASIKCGYTVARPTYLGTTIPFQFSFSAFVGAGKLTQDVGTKLAIVIISSYL